MITSKDVQNIGGISRYREFIGGMFRQSGFQYINRMDVIPTIMNHDIPPHDLPT